MNFNPAAIIAGAVQGAAEAVIPGVAQDVARTIGRAADQPATQPAPPPPPSLDADALSRQIIERVLADPKVQQMTTPLPWYQSQAIWGSILAVAAPIAGALGYAVTAEDQALYAQQLALVGTGLASAIGGGLMIYGRLTTTRPIKAG